MPVIYVTKDAATAPPPPPSRMITIIRYKAPPLRPLTGSKSSNWGACLREMRVNAGLSQRQLASITSIDRAIIRRIEAGTAPGNIDVIEKIAFCLGFEFDLMMLPPYQDPNLPETSQAIA
ncbi:helix-turn-helix domain-containing protein [Roseococcus pinisoli]|uniref:Helix-turn-helix transcriptional regulator n=1 Tax=Roseococcus pinisoli TaxID=2835040 RepID=A0ABS5QFR6_9PROT|nr:helix-turn-helix transcriptional regulator [Roseococcus pinisoli]MBS7812402.1 helix-turn-helix transcriptional regulator [Roseococcus pinisoli]